MQISVVVKSGPDAGRSFPIVNGEEFWIGRGMQSNTRLSDPSVSRLHCRLDVVDGKIQISDQSSRTGTTLNGVPVKSSSASPGDTIVVGETGIQLQPTNAVEAVTTAPKRRPVGVGQVTDAGSFSPGAQQKVLSSEAESLPAIESETTVSIDPVKRTRDSKHLHRLVGKTLFHYRIEQELVRGRTGTVFRAVDENSETTVALKVLWPHITKNDGERERFIRAMQTTLPIEHENLVRVVNAATTKLTNSDITLCWYAMEFIDGHNLREVAKRHAVAGMLDWKNVWRVAIQMAKALQVAYEHRIIHRSITPENILMPKNQRIAKLGDLVLAKALEGTQGEEITRRGELVGEVAYMAPERTKGETGDHRADQFSLGVTLYEVLCGRKPFEALTISDLTSEIQSAEPLTPRLIEMSIDERFEAIIMRLLEKKPSERFATPEEFLNELTSVGRLTGLIKH